MCGLAGEVRRDGRPADAAAVADMADTMAARGPDGSGLWAQGPVALGHRRLQIIDLSARGAQPMVDPDLGLAVVFNGCIYNYRQLRDELGAAGYRWFSTSDTEVVLKAFHRWGPSFVERLQGMFALCVAERDSGRVVLARDRIGIKPLYLADVAGALRFASTLPALLAGGGINTNVDAVALHNYLSFHSVVPAPRTIIRGVQKLAPATVMVVEPGGERRERIYWDPPYERRPEHASMGPEDWNEAVLEGLRTAVDRRLVADVPVGVLLSGGLDSSLVVALLAEAGQRGLATFSVGFDALGDLVGDEFRYSDVVAERFGTNHHRFRVGPERLVPALRAAVAAMSEPMVSHDAVAFYLLAEEVSRHVKVVQSGQGADEVFAGYHWYPPVAALDAEARRSGGSLDLGRVVDAYVSAFFDRSHEGVAAIVAPDWQITPAASRAMVSTHIRRPGAADALDRVLRLDSRVMLVDDPVKRVDNMTMAWGLEARVPFLDHELVELAAACPPELKLAHGGKGPLKEIGRRLLPAEVVDRPKGYFPVPALTRLEGPYRAMAEEALRAPEAKQRGLFRPGAVDRLLADPNAELTPLGGNQVWQLALLELWLQTQGVT